MANYRFDEDFDGFLEDFGKPHDQMPISESVIEAYRHKLPERLFVYWRALGACGFHNGLFWIVNPEDYQDLLDSWLEGTPFEQRTGLSVIARTAFGVLYVWEKSKGWILKVHPSVNLLSYNSKVDGKTLVADQEERKLQYFFGARSLKDCDETDESDKLLFDRVLKKLGPIGSDEMYAFRHRLALGGKETVSNVEIVKLAVYHDIAQQMEPPQIITVN